MFSGDAEAFRLFLGDRWTPWNVDESWLRPFDSRFSDVRPDSQVWVREHATAPWVLDVPFTPETDGLWINKRWRAQVAPLGDVTWVADDGLRYQRPEVTLMFKARQDREKDRVDAQVTLPMLNAAQRRWLRDTVALLHPDHPWVTELR